jgi:NADPH-dependent 2,4-dienoyl-CoA reductase/sulfur reductase-like enzyme
MKVIVIGCTHAGTSAVKTILAHHPGAEVVVYEQNDNISFLSCGIALYVGGVVKDVQGLFYSNPAELESLGATIFMEHRVNHIDSQHKTLMVTDLQTNQVQHVSYDKLVITTGSWPIVPKILGVESQNILLCKNFAQAQTIIEKEKTAQKVTVIGAGYIGVELVEAFRASDKEVTLIDSLPRVLNKYLDQVFTDVVEAEMRAQHIDLVLNEQVNEFLADDTGQVSAVKTTNQTIATDLVILCVGFRPNTELIKNEVATLPNGAIKVNEYMQSSDPDIYAAGDAAVIYHNACQAVRYLPLATNAVRQGVLVGLNIEKPTVKSVGAQGTSGLHFFGWNIGTTGLTQESAKEAGIEAETTYFEDNYRPEFMPTTTKIMMELIVEKGTERIIGGQMMSKYDITQSVNTLSLAISQQLTVEELAFTDFLFQPHFDRPWHYVNLLAQAAYFKA